MLPCIEPALTLFNFQAGAGAAQAGTLRSAAQRAQGMDDAGQPGVDT